MSGMSSGIGSKTLMSSRRIIWIEDQNEDAEDRVLRSKRGRKLG